MSFDTVEEHTASKFRLIELVRQMLKLLALDGGKLSASCPHHLSPQEKAHGIHWQSRLVKWANKNPAFTEK
jgi:hypothetical protein